MSMPTVGAKAPWPKGLTNQDGAAIDLATHAGRHVLVYFYPKDDTPGCTVEACNFRDHSADIDAVIYGVSLDDAASHKAFRAKFKLPFDLIVDADKALANAYGTLASGGQYPSRSSFLIGPQGTLKAVWPKVDPKVHWEEVKAAIAAP
jgi:peroxiredoxin Q/BCP